MPLQFRAFLRAMRPHIQINLRASDESGEDVGELDLGSDDDDAEDGDNHEEGVEQQQGATGVSFGIIPVLCSFVYKCAC